MFPITMIYVFPLYYMAIHKALTFICGIFHGLKSFLKPPRLLHGSNSLYRCAGRICTLQLQVETLLTLPTNSFIPFAMSKFPTVT